MKHSGNKTGQEQRTRANVRACPKVQSHAKLQQKQQTAAAVFK